MTPLPSAIHTSCHLSPFFSEMGASGSSQGLMWKQVSFRAGSVSMLLIAPPQSANSVLQLCLCSPPPSPSACLLHISLGCISSLPFRYRGSGPLSLESSPANCIGTHYCRVKRVLPMRAHFIPGCAGESASKAICSTGHEVLG